MDATEPRFEKGGTDTTGGKLRNRYDPIGGQPERSNAPGDFLARLWTLFGPPDEVGEGFAYHLRDRLSGLSFTAYSGPSGPAYAGARRDAPILASVLDDFDRLLDATPLADCSIEYGSELGAVRVGASGGRAFEVPAASGRLGFDTKLFSAKALLEAGSASPWAHLNLLLELTAARERMQEEGGSDDSAGYEQVARKLWVRSLEAIESFAEDASAAGTASPGEIETLAEVALVQLGELAETGIVSLAQYRPRIEAVEARLRTMGEGSSPESGADSLS
jgi:hypothetical protein